MSLDPMPDAATLLRMKAEREARSKRATFGLSYAPVSGAAVVETETVAGAGYPIVTMGRWEGTAPIRLRIPWSALVSDNAKYGVVNGKLIAQKPYRDAKKRIGQLAADVMDGLPTADFPLRLEARVYLPDNRVHDVVNFSKCVHDALKGTVFTDDRWLYDVRWIRAGVDVDAPRAEIVIAPLTPPSP